MQPTAVDFETDLFGPGNMAPEIVCGSFCGGGFGGVLAAPEALDLLASLLADPSRVIVGANTAYDLVCAAAARPSLLPAIFSTYAAGRVHDVLIDQKLLDIARGVYRGAPQPDGGWVPHRYNLAAVAQRQAGIVLDKAGSTRLTFGDLKGLPVADYPPGHYAYALADAEATLKVFDQHRWAPDPDRLLQDAPAQNRAAFALQLASVWGITTDPEGIEILRDACETTLADLQPRLETAGLLTTVQRGKKAGEVKRKTRHAQALRLAAAGGDFARVTLTDKGLELKDAGEDWRQAKYIKVNAEACRDSGDPILEDYSTYSQVSNLLVGHVKAMQEGVDLPIHTRFDVLMETGRTSSSAPNIQNVRRAPGARECFRPRPGQAFIACDYGSAELHTLAQICIDLFGESVLGHALNNGIDAHLTLGARLLNIPYDQALAKYKAGDPLVAEYRTRGKPGNFGFAGGMGAKGMVSYAKAQYGMTLTMHESQQLKAGWERSWPVVAEKYLGEYIRNLTARGDCTIRHHRSGRYRGGCRYTVAANTHFQGLAADGAKAALWEVSRLCYSPGNDLSGCRVVNFIHDEILLEAPLERVTPAALLLQKTMVEVFNRYTPDVPVSADPVAMDRWSKKAKPIWEEGELKVWKFKR